MIFRSVLPLLVLATTSSRAAVIATNTFTGINIGDPPSSTATSAWTPGPGGTGITFGNTFTSSVVLRNTVAVVDGGANLSLNHNFSDATLHTLSFTLTTGATPVALGQFSFQYYATNANSNHQATGSPTATFTLAISGGATPINAGTINVQDLVSPLSSNFALATFTIGTTLEANTTYTFGLELDATGSYMTLDNFTLDTVPEPSVALLGLLGLGVLVPRRR